MNVVHLLPVGKLEPSLPEDLRRSITRCFGVRAEILPVELDPAPAYHVERQQYHSSELLQRMQALVRPEFWRVIGITAVDLYIPILKYVFGEAQLGGPCAIVSFHRLRQQFYGLDLDDALLSQRLLKESVHELGHTFHLHHCQDYRCAMASAHAVEWIDLRENSFCESCRSQVEYGVSSARGLQAEPKSLFP
jgi:archaemetzincin